MTDPRLRRIQQLIELRNTTQQDVSVRAGLSRSAVNTYIKKGVVPGGDALMGIAKALGTSVEYIMTGHEPNMVKIPVVGIASAGEGWTIQSDAGHDPVSFDIGAGETVAIEVRGDSMAPVYRTGDFLICSKTNSPRHIDNLIGLDCVVMTDDGDGYIKILKRGTVRGKFNLKSYNPHFDDIENVEIKWVAPIQWIKRGSR